MSEDTYQTIQEASEGLYKEKGSRFIAYAYPVNSEEEVRRWVAALKEKYHDARHHCFAWKLGASGQHFRANDDGEPSSSAGKPILGQILSHNLTNILIVVVRYFGGIKLGVPGLINAYRQAAADALEHAIIIEKTVDQQFQIHFSYLVLNDVMKVIKETGADIIDRHFEMECSILLSIRQKDSPTLTAKLEKIESLSIEKENQ